MRLHFVFAKCSGYTFFVTLITSYTLVTKWISTYTYLKQILCLFKALKFNTILVENARLQSYRIFVQNLLEPEKYYLEIFTTFDRVTCLGV